MGTQRRGNDVVRGTGEGYVRDLMAWCMEWNGMDGA